MTCPASTSPIKPYPPLPAVPRPVVTGHTSAPSGHARSGPVVPYHACATVPCLIAPELTEPGLIEPAMPRHITPEPAQPRRTKPAKTCPAISRPNMPSLCHAVGPLPRPVMPSHVMPALPARDSTHQTRPPKPQLTMPALACQTLTRLDRPRLSASDVARPRPASTHRALPAAPLPCLSTSSRARA